MQSNNYTQQQKETLISQYGGWHKLEDCEVFVSLDPPGWHLSISHKSRYPTYEEIKQARYDFLPDDLEMAMVFPAKKDFVNLHPNCFHLWEI